MRKIEIEEEGRKQGKEKREEKDSRQVKIQIPHFQTLNLNQDIQRHPAPRVDLVESDISEDQSAAQLRHYSDLLYGASRSVVKEVVIASERKQYDMYLYDIASSVKSIEACVVMSRKRISDRQCRVEANYLKVGNRLIYFQSDCRFA